MNINIEKYREKLIASGFAEASQRPFHFWKTLTEKTAFIINLKSLPDSLGIVYGIKSTAMLFMDGDWDYFRRAGCDDDDINLRFYSQICTEQDEAELRCGIESLYEKYRHTDKDSLLAEVKELRKQFIQQITNVLKPLGFRKKGNQWRKALSENIVLQFWADKSPYCDLYYFEVDIFSLDPPGGVFCYHNRLLTRGTDVFDFKLSSTPDCLFDWQLQTTEELLEIVNRAWEQEMRPFVENGISEMGKQPVVWKRCICNRDRCADCWVEKNLWEAKEFLGTGKKYEC